MASDTHGLEALAPLSSNPEVAPVEPKRDAFGRSYATGKRKNAIAKALTYYEPGLAGQARTDDGAMDVELAEAAGHLQRLGDHHA